MNLTQKTWDFISQKSGYNIKDIKDLLEDTSIYVTCFSKDRDSYSIWKNYGKSENACNIGINFIYSTDFLISSTSCRLGDIVEVDACHKEGDMVKHLFNCYAGEVQYLNKSEINKKVIELLTKMEKEKNKYNGNFQEMIIQYLYCLQIIVKKPTLKHIKENEFRIFLTPNDEGLKYYDKNKISPKYLKVTYNCDLNENNRISWWDNRLKVQKEDAFLHTITAKNVISDIPSFKHCIVRESSWSSLF